MKVTKRYNQHRRDLAIDMQCEKCGATDTYDYAYDDDNFWRNVVPSFSCKECGVTSLELGLEPEDTHTKYKAWEEV